jgi:hypothetical protein
LISLWKRFIQWASAHVAGTAGPSFLGLALDRICGKRDQRRLYFITDGGHHENLGLWPLLERRCRLIFASDASEDGTSGFADLLRVIRRARVELGIRIVCAGPPAIDAGESDEAFSELLELLRSANELTDEQVERQTAEGTLPPRYRRSSRHFFLAKIVYPNDNPGYLIYLKPTLTGDEDADLQAYASQNRDFPHHPTPDQLYDEDRFESYRQLGEHIGDRLCDEFRDGNTATSLWDSQSILTSLSSEDPDFCILQQQQSALKGLNLEQRRRRRRIQRVEQTHA